MSATIAVPEKFPLGRIELQAITAGSGRPLLILHEEMGYAGWMQWHEELARDHSLVIPLAPGFGAAPRIEWLRNVRDLASVYARLIRERNLAPIDVIGFSMGGWIAAEIASFNPQLFRRMVLVAPLGIRPAQGEILDAFSLSHHDHLRATVFDSSATPEFGKLYGGAATLEQLEALDEARAESSRLAWQPYLYNPSLPHLLEGVGGKLPMMLIWGEQDRVVPVSAAEQYRAALGMAQVLTLPRCGHRPEIECVKEFVGAVRKFLA